MRKLNPTIPLNVVDAGARYGIHPTFEELRDIAQFHLFEVDGLEVERLKKKYARARNIQVHGKALWSCATELSFIVRRHRGLTSVYDTNQSYLNKENHMVAAHEPVDRVDIAADSVDACFAESAVHFLKIDAEGGELEILKGARNQLERSILGVRAEVAFAPILENRPLFGEIHAYLTSLGFELLNFDYDGRGLAKGPFTKPDRYGKLIATDAVWVCGESRIYSNRDAQNIADIVRLAVFLMLNQATDVAISLLLEAKSKGIHFSELWEEPVFSFLHFKIMTLIKELSYSPQMEKSALFSAYETIFEREFPDLNAYYEQDEFN